MRAASRSPTARCWSSTPGPGSAASGLARPTADARCNILLTHLHLDHIQGLVFFAPLFQPRGRDRDLGPGHARRRACGTASPATSRRRCPRSRCASCPADVSFREADPERMADRLGARSAPPRSPTAARRSATGSRSGDACARLHPRPRARRWARDSTTLEPEWISGFGLAQRRRPADPRRPVHRRGVPDAPRLGTLGALRRAGFRPPRAAPAHCCSSTTTRCIPTTGSTRTPCGRRRNGRRAAAPPGRSSWPTRARATKSIPRPASSRSRRWPGPPREPDRHRPDRCRRRPLGGDRPRPGPGGRGARRPDPQRQRRAPLHRAPAHGRRHTRRQRLRRRDPRRGAPPRRGRGLRHHGRAAPRRVRRRDRRPGRRALRRRIDRGLPRAQGGAPRPRCRRRRRRLRDLRGRQADQHEDDPRVDPARRRGDRDRRVQGADGAEARGLGRRRGDAAARGARPAAARRPRRGDQSSSGGSRVADPRPGT